MKQLAYFYQSVNEPYKPFRGNPLRWQYSGSCDVRSRLKKKPYFGHKLHKNLLIH